MKTVLVAGATGYLGRYLCAEYQARGWTVVALVRDAGRAGELAADRMVEAQATRPETLAGAMSGADLVVSALGITRQRDGLSYRDVDYQANLNLLTRAIQDRVPQFAYIHVLNADRMAGVPLVAAKSAFVRALQEAPIRSTVIAPSGYFSDMTDFLSMARGGRVWLFGRGEARLNPIHGADLAKATADAVDGGVAWLDAGGPDVFTQNELARLCFDTVGKPARITRLPDMLRRAAIRILPRVAPARIAGPAQFFLTAMGLEMVGQRFGTHHLADHFRRLHADG
ncbi:SDR family oxidoreductase [Microbulbifer sp. S227A]|uniref:SDR family oxidoreductase n=1 Tax=Microbulbifer sp. S227A TaxID=3415131 RepID=UPI003C7E465E